MDLRKGKRIHANHWTGINITDKVIRCAEELAEKEGINAMVDGKSLFEWEPGSPMLPEHAVEEVTSPFEDKHATQRKRRSRYHHL